MTDSFSEWKRTCCFESAAAQLSHPESRWRRAYSHTAFHSTAFWLSHDSKGTSQDLRSFISIRKAALPSSSSSSSPRLANSPASSDKPATAGATRPPDLTSPRSPVSPRSAGSAAARPSQFKQANSTPQQQGSPAAVKSSPSGGRIRIEAQPATGQSPSQKGFSIQRK